MKRLKIGMFGTLFISLVLIVVPPNIGSSQNKNEKEVGDLIQKTNTLIDRTNTVRDKMVSKPPEIEVVYKPVVSYKTKTKVKTIKVEREVIIKSGDLYFKYEPSKDDQGNYIIDVKQVDSFKKAKEKELGLGKKWYQIF